VSGLATAIYEHRKREFVKSSISHSGRVSAPTIAIIGLAYFVIAVVALYFLNPAYNLASSIQGNYDLGSYEFLIASTFFGLGLGSLALAIGLHQVISRSARSRIGLVLLGIWGLGIFLAGIFPANAGGSTVPHMTTVLIAGIFPVDVEAYPETIFSFIHVLTILGSFVSLALAAILLACGFRQDDSWRRFRPAAVILALLTLLAAILFIPTFLYPSLFSNAIFSPVFFVITGIRIGIIWLMLTAARLRFVAYK
jgi:hypothetical protein